MQKMDLDIASEFVQMASHLLYLKTRELLTTEEEVSELELLMESLEQLPVYGLFFLDDGAVRNNKSLGNLNPGEVFIYRGIENIR